MFGKKRTGDTSGFTLIEVMVVITIVGLLASFAMVPLSESRAKARDAARITTVLQIRNALAQYREQFGRYPLNYSGGDPSAPVFVAGGVAPTLPSWGACDRPLPGIAGGGVVTPGCPLCSAITLVNPLAYEASMQELVNAGFLSVIPRSNPGEPAYCYQAIDDQAYIVTTLEASIPSTRGAPGSCRPYATSNLTWCESGTPNRSHCMCVGE
ncbi:type II secretion system GspH family protein [Patescibacteria group bacterium]|nr:type II secretion system GspH family protein [Patescibacteria group bacterium]